MTTLGRKSAVVAAAAATVLGSVAASAAPASAARAVPATRLAPQINRVTCGSRTDWLRIFSDATTCWANAGLVNVRLYNVYEWCAGNNNGYLLTSRGTQNFKAHTCGLFGGSNTATVTRIVIYN